MKTEKLSLNNIKNVLSRSEMKKIMAGSGTCRSYQSAGPYLIYGSCVTMSTAQATPGSDCCDSCASHGFPSC